MASQSLKLIDQNIEGLFNCHNFYGELSREDATEILNEAAANDGESRFKMILFLETNRCNPWYHESPFSDFGKNRFAIMQAIRSKRPDDIQPKFVFSEIWKTADYNSTFGIISDFEVVRKNPFSLEVLAAVKVASSGFNLETQGLPSRIKEEVKKYQDLNERIKSSMSLTFNAEMIYHNY